MQQCPSSRPKCCSTNQDLTPTYLRLSLQSGPFPSDFSTNILDEFLMSAMRSIYHILFMLICLPIEILGPYTGVLISPYPDPTEKTIEISPFFIRRGGHSCCGDLVGRKTF